MRSDWLKRFAGKLTSCVAVLLVSGSIFCQALAEDKPPAGPAAAAASAPRLRHFDAETVSDAETWQRESVAVIAEAKRLAPLLAERKAAGPEKDYGTPLNAKALGEIDKGRYTRQEVSLDIFDNWTTTAIVTVPKQGGPFPAVVFIEGKVERPYESPTACGTVLAEAGYVTLSVNVQGDKVHKPELGGHERIVPGIRAVDYLCTRPYVDKERIGCAGLCRWGMIATFVAQLDPRIKATVSAANLIKGQTGRYYTTVGNDPFDLRDSYSVLAPRPLLCQFGKADQYAGMFPSEKDLADVRRAYQVFGRPERLEVFWHPGGHMIEGSSLPGFFARAFGMPQSPEGKAAKP